MSLLSSSFLQYATTVFLFIFTYQISHAKGLDLYSETVYDSRFEGAVTDSRLRYSPIGYKSLKPYVALNFSRDLSNGSAPAFTINAISPSTGVNFQFFKYFNLNSEYRKIFTKQNIKKDEFRLGVSAYYFYASPINQKSMYFNEMYSESFHVSRVSHKPYFVFFNKSGYRKKLTSSFSLDLFLEGFTKSSPDLGYGPSEHEFRLGLRPRVKISNLSVLFSTTYAPVSNTKENGFDAMLVLSGGF